MNLCGICESLCGEEKEKELGIFCDHVDNPLQIFSSRQVGGGVLTSLQSMAPVTVRARFLIEPGEDLGLSRRGWGRTPHWFIFADAAYEHIWYHLLLLSFLVSLSQWGHLSLDSLVQWPSIRGSCGQRKGRVRGVEGGGGGGTTGIRPDRMNRPLPDCLFRAATMNP